MSVPGPQGHLSRPSVAAHPPPTSDEGEEGKFLTEWKDLFYIFVLDFYNSWNSWNISFKKLNFLKKVIGVNNLYRVSYF